MRVAVVTESFLPTINGVSTSVSQVLRHLRREGHDAIVLVPAAGAPAEFEGFAVHEMPAVAYRQFPVGLPNPAVARLLADFRPDVLHAASPFLLGAQAIAAANRLGIPSVAIYQTDVAGYARRNRLAGASALAWRTMRWIHNGADLTLGPSSAAIADLERAGVERVHRWGRGVDLERYHPRNRTRAGAVELRRRLSPSGEVVVGYVGRVAPEKQLERFAAMRGLDGIRLAIVGDGPSLPELRRRLRGIDVDYLGTLRGDALADAYAAFDLFVHPGTEETFGQTLQEAHASGLPVLAPHAGGPIDLVEHGVDGYLFDAVGEERMRLLAGALVGDAALRARLGEAGRRKVLGRSWEAVCGDLVGFYRRAMTDRVFKTVSTSR
jgi:phosphatidylinositol alpha 1,6-mannosyltransferase